MNSIRAFTPEVFNAAAVKKHGVVYAETRRDLSAPLSELSGSMSVQEYFGDIPLVISEKNYERSGATLPFEQWGQQIESQFRRYDEELKRQLGLYAIGYPRPVHGMNLIDLDTVMRDVDINTPFLDRLEADTTLLTKEGIASCIAPADCIVANIVDVRTGALMQAHAGYLGAENGIFEQLFDSTSGLIDPKQSVAYFSPHAQAGFVINQKNNFLVERFEANPRMRPYIIKNSDGTVELNLAEASKAQLVAAGVSEANIEISPDNSLTDPTLYSQSNFLTRGINGRNGMVFGKSAK
ncbi:MAG: laccase domain-containing protein [Patescibacteria group bacterium]